MKTLRCNCGKDILLDDDVYEKLKERKWTCKGQYDVRATNAGHVRITWLILRDIPHDKEPDHVDRDVHNNQRANLRLASHSENVANQGVRSDSRSGVKGVIWHNRVGKWWARVTKNGKKHHAGYHSSLRQAAIAYNTKAKELFGEFAYQNEIEGLS